MVDTKEDLLNLNPTDFINSIIPEDEIIRWFDLLDAAWVHSGNPKDPHAKLTSGWCSNGFFDCLRVLKYVNLSEILAYQLYLRMRDRVDYRIDKTKWTIGSPMAAITFAHDVARAAGIPINQFVEKDPADPKGKRMIWKRMAIPEGDNVLQIEELITTSYTTNEIERAVREGNPHPVTFVPYIGAIVHRPPKMVRKYGDREVVALIEKEVWAVPPEECTLCKQGSKRLRPKTNWKELTGKS
jgi:orotate phosphoribosyltransferase